MLDRVARLLGAPCLLVRGTRRGGVAFCRVNGSSWAILANRGEINRENMAARSEYFRSYYLPVLSAEQNDRQSEEINVTDEPQAENRPVPVQEAEIRWTKSFLGRPLCLFCLAATQKITHGAHSLSLLGELYVKAGYICFNPSSWVAQLSGAPSLHVNRPLGFCPFILKLLQCLCKSRRKRNPNKSKISREHFYRG